MQGISLSLSLSLLSSFNELDPRQGALLFCLAVEKKALAAWGSLGKALLAQWAETLTRMLRVMGLVAQHENTLKDTGN